jgi:hypothetical protein
MKHGDTYVIVLLMLILFVWLYVRMKRKWVDEGAWRVPNGEDAGMPDPDLVAVLEQAGYSLVSGKQRIPIVIHADHERMESRIFIDGLVEREEELFVLRVARERMPMEWTGSSIRDHLLPLHLLYKSAAGIVYIDPKSGFLRQIRFDIEH